MITRQAPAASTPEQVLAILSQVTGLKQLAQNLDLRLYDLELLDSFKTVELIVAFSEKLGVEIAPAEFEREQWATPRKIVAYIENRLSS